MVPARRGSRRADRGAMPLEPRRSRRRGRWLSRSTTWSAVRRLHRRRSRQLRSPARRDLRAARAQRRRQDDDLPHALRPAPATSGTLRVAGVDLGRARASARQRIGYVAQKFSLYGQLSVAENLDFFASAYGLRGARRRERIAWALEQFELEPLMRQPSGLLPGGYKQRLAMAAALLHEPEILFLDEPTSGADPLARREFWRRITALAEQGRHRDRHHAFHGGGGVLRPRRHPRCRPGAGPRHAGRDSPLRGRVEGARADDGGRLHRHRRGGPRGRGQPACTAAGYGTTPVYHRRHN